MAEELIETPRGNAYERGPVRPIPKPLAQPKEGPGFFDAYSAAADLEHVAMTTMSNLKASGFEYDPEFRSTPEIMTEWTKDIPPEYHGEFLDAMSEDHGYAIRNQITEALESERKLGGMGFKGVGYRMLAAVTDPAAWALTLATEGAAAPWIFANKASRLQRGIRAALAAGGTNAALESYLYSQSPTKSASDILWAGVFGAALGGLTAPLVRRADGSIDEAEGATEVLRQRQMDETLDAIDVLEESGASTAGRTAARTVVEEEAEGAERGAASAGRDRDEETAAQVEELRETRRSAKAATRAAEAQSRRVEETTNRIASISDELIVRQSVINWLRVLARNEEIPNLRDTEKLDLISRDADGDAVYDFLSEAEVEELLTDLEVRFKDKTTKEIRSELQAEYKKLLHEKNKALNDLDKMSSRVEPLRRRAAKLVEKEKELLERLHPRDTKGPSDSVGAQRVDDDGEDYPIYDDGNIDDILDALDQPITSSHWTQKLRYDIVGRLLNSGNPIFAHMALKLGEDAVSGLNATSASEIGRWLQRIAHAHVNKTAAPAFKEWAQAKGLGRAATWLPSRRREFFQEVSDYIEFGGSGAHESVKRTAKVMQEEYNNFLQKAKEAGVKGFDKIPDNPNYLPRFINRGNIRYYGANFADSDIVKLIAEGIRRAVPDIDAKKAIRGSTYSEWIAKGYWKKVRSLSQGLEVDFHIPLGDSDMILRILKEDGVDPDIAEGIAVELKRINAKKSGGVHSRAKQRLDLDLDTTMSLKNRETGEMEEVRLASLFERDAEKLFAVYSRQMSGQIALAKMGFKSRKDFDDMMKIGKQRGQETGVKGTEKQAELLELMYKSIIGSPLETNPDGFWQTAGRMLRDWNFIRIMNQVGFAQVAEFGNMVGTVGWKAVLTHIPEVVSTLKRLRTGELDDDLASQLEAITGIGTDRLRNQVSTRYDEHGYGAGKPGSALDRYDTGAQYGKRVTADISMMSGINMILQRTAVKATLQHLLDTALGNSKEATKRLATLGLRDDMKDRVLQLLRDHASRQDSMFGKGRKINGLDLDAMQKADPDATDQLIHSLNRAVARIIQENDIGATHELMHTSIGKIIFQFRSFMMVAWGKQTLHNLYVSDARSASAFFHSMVFGGLSYAVQQKINSVGREDSKEWLDERLNWKRLGAAAFQRSGHASLVPAVTDSIWATLIDDEPIFAYGRSTGLASSAVLGNPTMDTVLKSISSLGMAKNFQDDYDLSQKQVRDLWSLLWFSNAMGMRNLSYALMEDLPQRSNQEY